MADAKVLIYSKVPCSYCDSAKRFLQNRNIPYAEIDLTNQQDEILRLKQQLGAMTIPIILINGKLIGGYIDLKALEEQGKLDQLLKE